MRAADLSCFAHAALAAAGGPSTRSAAARGSASTSASASVSNGTASARLPRVRTVRGPPGALCV